MADWITGREIILGIKKASTWRSSVTLEAGDGLLISKESIGTKAPSFVDDTSLGVPDVGRTIQVAESVTGASIEGLLRYEGWDLLLALALGAAGTPSNVEGAAYSNTYSAAENLAGLFATLAIKKANTAKGIWEVPSVKITGFTISGRVGELVKVIINFMGNKIEIANPLNSDLSSVTYPEGMTKDTVARMDNQFKIRMNAQGGSALTDSDKIFPSEFELVYERPFEEQFEAGFSDMSEPVQSDFASATIKLTFDKYNLDDFTSAIADEADKKMDLTFTGPIITGSTRYTFRVDLPKVTWQSAAADVNGPGLIKHVVDGKLLRSDSAPEGMTGVLGPVSVSVINERAQSPLA
ncbi:MAG: hypothetical protein JRI85_11915 [Deltaproteobacteria bacterium]|nr:hypothetical protein [Deltaproteobacteria bacterium]